MTIRSAALAVIVAVASPALARPAPAKPIDADAAPRAVTAYPGRASVTRTARPVLPAGVHELEFGALPETVDAASIQARARGGGAKILGVEYTQRAAATAASARLAELDARIEAKQEEARWIDQDRAALADRKAFLDAVGVRAAADATDAGGTEALDLGAVREELAFLTEQRSALLDERRDLEAAAREIAKALKILMAEREAIAGASGVNRAAIVTVAVTAPGAVEIDLVYLVGGASWEPSYDVRAAPDGSQVDLEYNAVVVQRTGEDWNDVELTLSTARPTVAANPPRLEAWYIDVAPPPVPMEARMEQRRAPPGARAGRELMDKAAFAAGEEILGVPVERLAADAEIAGAGPSVTYTLPRRVTILSGVDRTQRTRIANVATAAKFVHVALPLLTEAVYIRGELVNASAYQLLPGSAAIFVGSDYVGPTRLAAVPPNGSFDLYFGIDPAVTAKRQLVEKTTTKTGLLGGGRRTSYDYRIAIENGAGKAIDLELWDRIPVSRTDQIVVDLEDPTPALSKDAAYLEEQRPTGLLRWDLSVPPLPPAPPGAAPRPFVVTYGLRITRSKDVEMTPLPE